jgi:hypothetical protein
MSTIRAIISLRLIKIAVLWLTIALPFAAAAAADSKRVSVNEIVDLKSVTSIRVLCMPEHILVRIALTPELLIANYRSSFELERPASKWAEFERAAERTTLEDSGERGDHRWAILFRDSAGRTRHTLAVDRTRRLANLDGKAYKIRGELLSWLKGQSKLLVNRTR